MYYIEMKVNRKFHGWKKIKELKLPATPQICIDRKVYESMIPRHSSSEETQMIFLSLLSICQFPFWQT